VPYGRRRAVTLSAAVYLFMTRQIHNSPRSQLSSSVFPLAGMHFCALTIYQFLFRAAKKIRRFVWFEAGGLGN